MPGRDSDTARLEQLTSHPRLGGLLLNFLAAAVGLGVVLGVIAYAVSVPNAGSAQPEATAWTALGPALTSPARIGGERAPTITTHPQSVETSAEATFAFTEPAGAAPLSCRLDEGAWSACSSPVTLGGLGLGVHDFIVRAAHRGAAGGRPMSYMRWRVASGARFKITPQLSDLDDLYPGATPMVLPVRVTNPNKVPIAVTGLSVAVPVSPRGCPADKNLRLTRSNASVAKPLRIRAGGSVWLPGRGITAPSIRLLERPVNQDACQSARFKLVFAGNAHG